MGIIKRDFNKTNLSPDEAVKLGKKKRELLEYCMCGSYGKLRMRFKPPIVLCEDCDKSR